MANRRMLSNTLGGSKKFAKLFNVAGLLADFCQVVYLLGLPWTDDVGQVSADPWEWKNNFFRVSPKSQKTFKKALSFLVSVNLLEMSTCGKALRYTNFFKFQTLKNDRNPKNDYPGIQWIPMDSGGFPKVEVEVKGSKDKLSEVNKEENKALSIWKSSKKKILTALIEDEKQPDAGKQSYDTWFEQTIGYEFTDGKLIIMVPNIFVANWLSDNYKKIIIDALDKEVKEFKFMVMP